MIVMRYIYIYRHIGKEKMWESGGKKNKNKKLKEKT